MTTQVVAARWLIQLSARDASAVLRRATTHPHPWLRLLVTRRDKAGTMTLRIDGLDERRRADGIGPAPDSLRSRTACLTYMKPVRQGLPMTCYDA